MKKLVLLAKAVVLYQNSISFNGILNLQQGTLTEGKGSVQTSSIR
jgi:hypothetical protein